MSRPEEPSTQTGERRVSNRRDVTAPLAVTVQTARFGGETENVSQAGVFFFSSDRVRVQVEIQEPGKPVVTRTGSLVRVERMSEDTVGYAIEFDRT